MEANYVSRFSGVCASGTDYRTLPEAKLWTQVIQQAIEDLDRRTSLISRLAQDSAREWFASESDGVGSCIWACQIIDVDPSFICSRLAKKQRMQKPEQAMRLMAQGAKDLRGKRLAAI